MISGLKSQNRTTGSSTLRSSSSASSANINSSGPSIEVVPHQENDVLRCDDESPDHGEKHLPLLPPLPYKGRQTCQIVDGSKAYRSITEYAPLTSGVFERSSATPPLQTSKTSLNCSCCSFKTYDSCLFSLHTQFCKGHQKAYKCSKCPYTARSPSALNYHQKTHSGEKPFACRFCSYRTILKRSLIVHLRTHTQEKPFACTQCSYRANQKSNLDFHMTRHLQKK